MDSTCTIKLCRVPLTLNHQIDFKSESDQISYFENNTIKTFYNCSYQPTTSSILIKEYVDNVTANYVVFTNQFNGTTKNYFAFIVSKGYVNKNTTELVISIDVIQTWLFDIYYKPCFIERAMASVDNIKDIPNIPEDLQIGDIITCDIEQPAPLSFDTCFILAISNGEGNIFGASYSPFQYIYYDKNHTSDLNNKIKSLMNEGKGDSIAYISCFPDGMCPAYENGSVISGYDGICQEHCTFEIDETKMFQGYTPYNAKLYQYPFSFISIKNNSGSNVILKRELLQDIHKLEYLIECVFTHNPIINLTPMHYGGLSKSYDDGISLNDYPLCGWNNDNYSNWYAQHQNSINAQSLNALTSFKTSSKIATNNNTTAKMNNEMNKNLALFNSGVGGLSNIAGGNIAGGLTSLVTGGVNAMTNNLMNSNSIANDYNNAKLSSMANYQSSINSLMASVEDMKVMPNTARGDTSANGLELARKNANFRVEVNSITSGYAEIVDMYFQQFGYKMNNIKKPKDFINTREKWNYIKTVGCGVYGEIPFEDIELINNIFDGGITFWHNEQYMFNYDQPNPIKKVN